ncbi:hypothetical protein AWL63_23990 (plasmid) [Sphingomonas panacis]|uniref:HTH araC/xylS-type domain-containing protein n=2 Tax=Sphingomonas panacis TaxID=1560345 RepID=A0A1B3ZIG5_9SPHN|nr:hypothetical protein AWL63_23990 [Sphingomonas panacis]
MVPARFGASQFVEASLTLEVRIIRMILGSENWSPVRVELAHHAPPTIRIQQNIFRCPMDFNSDRNAVVLKRRDLKQPSRNGNAQMFAFLERQIRTEDSAAPVELPRRVEQIIAAKLVRGEATLEHVAHGLGMSPRALQRHLAGHNLAFADLLIEVRTRITDEYFGGERRPNLTALAHRLGYSDNSAVSRFLRKHLNTGARALRAQKGAMKCREPALH